MQFEILFYAIKLCESSFSKTPEILNAIDMDPVAFWKFILTVIDSKMFVLTHIHQAIVWPPAIRINSGRSVDFPSYNGI